MTWDQSVPPQGHQQGGSWGPPGPPPEQHQQPQQWAPAPQQPGPAHAAPPARGQQLVTSMPFVIPRRPKPTRGWQRIAYALTGGHWNPGLSADERELLALRQAATRPLHGCRRIAIISRKGGVGKTTTTVGLGSALAAYRGDRVIALDGNPDAGNLADRVGGDRTESTVRDLINGADKIGSYTDMRGFTSQSGSRLESIAADQDPDISEAFSEAEYMRVQDVLANYYNVILTDCGTGVLHDAMKGVLKTADDLVICAGLSLDTIKVAGSTLDWLEAHGYNDLVANAVAVISPLNSGVVPPKDAERIDPVAVRDYFAGRCRTVIEMPIDPHLSVGAEVRIDEMSDPTQRAYLRMAAAIAERF